jgi:hypothetical protein
VIAATRIIISPGDFGMVVSPDEGKTGYLFYVISPIVLSGPR